MNYIMINNQNDSHTDLGEPIRIGFNGYFNIWTYGETTVCIVADKQTEIKFNFFKNGYSIDLKRRI